MIKTIIDKLPTFEYIIQVNGRVQKIYFMNEDEFAKTMETFKYDKTQFDGVIQGFAQMDNNIYLEYRQYTLLFNPKENDYVFDYWRMAKNLWHETGHRVEDTMVSSTIPTERVAVIFELAFMYKEQLDNAMEALKKHIKYWLTKNGELV